MEPPRVRFVTPVYHPNIDSASGSICLSILKMAPSGDWLPSLNIGSVLMSIRSLLSDPNAADGLDAEATSHYRRDPESFARKAAGWTRAHAQASAPGRTDPTAEDELHGEARPSKRGRSPPGSAPGASAAMPSQVLQPVSTASASASTASASASTASASASTSSASAAASAAGQRPGAAAGTGTQGLEPVLTASAPGMRAAQLVSELTALLGSPPVWQRGGKRVHAMV
jgi:hypothetical protein